MWDYQYLQEMSKGIPEIIRYGTQGDAHIIGKVVKNDPLLEVQIIRGMNDQIIETQLVGDYNLPNVLAAVAVGKFFGVAESQIKLALESYRPSNSRSQLIKQGTNKIILDAYNANPSSMKLAIDNFSKLPGNKVLILGSMAELGQESEKEHGALINEIKGHQWKYVALVGNEFQKTNHPFLQFKNSLEVKKWFHQQQFNNVNILIKGSRSMQMERTIEP
jgi:UDP-N-acetylmuramoyl-tripeptide--D-alanyl-D-alanine ligase